MIRAVQRFLGLTLCLATGCAALPRPAPTTTALPGRITLVVPGVFGDGPWYDGLRVALAADRSNVRTIPWGLPKALFAANFSNRAVHERAETELAAVLNAAGGEVDLVGHSAGCGVILGALAKTRRDVGRVVLIAPSVSPTYDTGPALSRTTAVDVFYSDRDTVFLKWRCNTFGTYDAVKTAAAGYGGFTGPADGRLRQHPYDPAWKALGHDGGHGGGTARRFVQAIIVPLLRPARRQ